ncbi:MAG: hypothetical protein EOP04_04800 [Proteobacteria bacterium]|nr:MAG: hypothetical protein EOP04_04800 [Pseudomonadota bacterium]
MSRFHLALGAFLLASSGVATADQFDCNFRSTDTTFDFSPKSVPYTTSQFRLGYDPQYPTRPDAYVVDFYFPEFSAFGHFFTFSQTDKTTEFKCDVNLDIKVQLPFYGRLKGKITEVISTMGGYDTRGQLKWNGSTSANGKEDYFSIDQSFDKNNDTTKIFGLTDASRVEWLDERQSVCGNEINLRIKDIHNWVAKPLHDSADLYEAGASTGFKVKFVRFEFHAINDGQGCI